MSSDPLIWLATEKGQLLIAGGAGAVVRWITLQDNWRQGIPNILVGCAVAYYATPLLDSWLHSFGNLTTVETNPGWSGMLGFICGMAGSIIAATIMELCMAIKKMVIRRGGLPDGK